MSEVPPATTPQEDEALKVVLVDQSHDAENEARDRADARLDQELGEGGRFKRFVNGIWKGNIAKEFYRQKYIHQELNTIQESDTVHASEPAERRTRALEATIDRFQSAHDELIHTSAGEHREVQEQDSQLSQGVKQLIRGFVDGRFNPDTLREERTRLLNEYRKEHGPEAAGKGLATTDNLLEIAQAVAGAVEHAESLENVTRNRDEIIDQVLGRVQVITGEARDGVRTEARHNKVDTVIDKLAKTKVGSMVNLGTLATAVAGAAFVARVGGQGVVGNLTRALVPGAAAGLWAGLRENKRTKDERAQHAREVATGGVFNEGDKRRVEMEATRYDTIPALDLIHHLRHVGDTERLDMGGSEAVQAAMDALAAVQARVELSDLKKLDLISFSSKTDVGEERMMLDLARLEARQAIEARLTDEMRAELHLGARADVRGLISQRANLVSEALVEGELSEKDKVFAKLKAKRVAKAAALGAGVGIVGGLVVQEVVAGIDPSRYGLIDAMRGEEAVPHTDGMIHQTTLESMFRGDETVVHTDPSSTYDTYTTATNGSVELSDDHRLVTNSDGTIDLKDGNGKLAVEGLTVDANGTFDQASLDKLDAAGMAVEDHSYDQDITTTTTATVSTGEYIQNHIDETTKVTRDFWYGNDTPGVYDENELRVYRGGSNEAPGIIDGGYQYTVAGMHADGSWQDGERVDWNQAAANGNLFVAVSGTYDSQGNPFMIPIGPNGEVNIPANSPAGQFFANENNSVAFNGAYMEIVQTAGVDTDGTVHIRPLATLVGDTSVHEINDTVTTVTTEHHAEYTITTNGYDTTQENFTEMAPITPIASRRSLEALAKQRRGEGERPGYYGGEVSDAERERIIAESSPRLRANPDAELNPGEEFGWYENELRRRKGDEYARDLATFADNDPVLRGISNNVEAIVTIPVAAAYEADNIYGTLSLYAQQDPEGVAKSVILLNVNWLDTVMDNPDLAAAAQKTMSEIERAKRDFPQLAISVMQKEYNEAAVSETGGVIGYVAEDLVNAALIAAQRRVASGEMSSDHDLLVVRGDADANGLSRRQLRNFQNAMAENRSLDVVKGATRFGVEDSVKFPGYGLASNFMSAFQILSTQENHVHTGGANFGIRASTLAAIGGLGDMMITDENGERVRDTGAGSDDVNIGRRVSAARNLRSRPATAGYTRSNASYTGGAQGNDAAERRIKLVSGAAVDTSADRLLAAYLSGENIQDVWNPEKRNGFAAGPGKYRSRTQDAAIIESAEKEDFNESSVYGLVERAMSVELSQASPAVGRRALALLFGSVPGAYIVSRSADTEGDEVVSFKLTAEGREFIRKRVERETNGRFGSYGARKMRQLYGMTKPDAKRQPVTLVPPLVSPLN